MQKILVKMTVHMKIPYPHFCSSPSSMEPIMKPPIVNKIELHNIFHHRLTQKDMAAIPKKAF